MNGNASSTNKFIAASMLIIAAISIAAYIGTIHSPYVYDDNAFLGNVGAFRQPPKWDDFFTRRYFDTFLERTYRPVPTASYFIDSSLWNLRVEGSHAFSILLHMLTAWLVFAILNAMLKSAPSALFGAAVFAAHPVHVEAVALISNREELFCALFFFLSFYLYVLWRPRGRHTVSFMLLFIISFLLAMFSKEMAASLPAILVVHDVVFRDRSKSIIAALKRGLPFYVVSGLVVLGFLVLRYTYLRNATGEATYPGGSIFLTFLTMSKVFFIYLKILFAPFSLCAMYVISVAKGVFSIEGLAAFFLLASIVCAVVFSRRAPMAAFSFLFFLVSWLPVSNIIPFGEFMSERYAYIPSFGLCVFAAWAGSKLRKSTAAAVCAVLITVLLAFLSYTRAGVWSSNAALWSNTCACAPVSSTAHLNLGNVFAVNGDQAGALREYAIAEGSPDVKEPQKIAYNKGLAFFALRDNKNAVVAMNRAIEIAPDYMEPYFFLGKIAETTGDFKATARIFLSAADKARNNAQAQYIAGAFFSRHAEPQQLVGGTVEQLLHDPKIHPPAWLNVPRLRKAEELLARSVALEPTFIDARVSLAVTRILLGDVSAGREELITVLSIDPQNPTAYWLIYQTDVIRPPEPGTTTGTHKPWFIVCSILAMAILCAIYVRRISTR